MATTTPNFGWDIPQSTDLVKDGATAIETLGDGIDASFVDLKGGTTGQVLAKASGTDLDFTWSNVDPLTILDAKGDLITAISYYLIVFKSINFGFWASCLCSDPTYTFRFP